MIGMNRQALNKPLSKYPRLRIAPDCTFCTIRNVQPRPQETHQHFYSECIYVERLWTDIRDNMAKTRPHQTHPHTTHKAQT